MSSDEALFRTLEQQVMGAVATRDTVALDALLDRDYRTVNEDGSAMDAAEALTEMRGPTPLQMPALPVQSEFLVRRFGETALVSARMTFGAGGPAADLRYLEVWVKRGGAWKFAHWQATRIQPEGIEREARLKV